MENDVLDSLEDIGYVGPLLSEGETNFNAALDAGPASVEYTELVSWLTTQVGQFCHLAEAVNPIKGLEGTESFLLELSGFLRECGCPHRAITDGPVPDRLSTRNKRLILLDYLLTELQALRMIAVDKPAVLSTAMDVDTTVENELASCLKEMLIAISFPKPPASVTPYQLFNKVESKVKEILIHNPGILDKPLLKARLSEKQWEKILSINDALFDEYKLRREMLLKRLDVTVQSFMWSDKAKKNENEISAVYRPIRKKLAVHAPITAAHVLSAREDLTRMEKTSSGVAREKTQCAVNKVMMGNVPDRGGRAYEMTPPAPEMPSFKRRSEAPQGQRPESARGGRGGRVQGGWDRPQSASGGGWGHKDQGQGQWGDGGHRGGGEGRKRGGRGGRGGGQQRY